MESGLHASAEWVLSHKSGRPGYPRLQSEGRLYMRGLVSVVWELCVSQKCCTCPALHPACMPACTCHVSYERGGCRQATTRPKPEQGQEVRAVACGGEHSLAATEAGDLFTWGWGRYGNLGLGAADDSLRPAKVWPIAFPPPPAPSPSPPFPPASLQGWCRLRVR